jgi:hypothetical protein
MPHCRRKEQLLRVWGNQRITGHEVDPPVFGRVNFLVGNLPFSPLASLVLVTPDKKKSPIQLSMGLP